VFLDSYKRVIYKKNPLMSVVCQLRFPPILAVDGSSPKEFQEKIRHSFPGYKEKIEIQQEFKSIINLKDIEQISNPMSTITSGRNYVFISDDNNWHINLTRTFISLTAIKYSQWEEFLDKIRNPLKIFLDIYKPLSYTRIGLRYIDIFNRSELNLKEVGWNELINPSMLSILASDISENDVSDFNSTAKIKLDDKGNQAIIKTMLLREVISNEACLSLDSDLYTLNKTLPEAAKETLSALHSYSTQILRYVIKDKLHFAMEPEEITP
jgi:uncharacterized protein (TIGR04255 family)